MKKTVVLALASVVLVLTGCNSLVLKTVMGTVDPYFHGLGIDGAFSYPS